MSKGGLLRRVSLRAAPGRSRSPSAVGSRLPALVPNVSEGSNTEPAEPRSLLSEQRRHSHQLGRGARPLEPQTPTTKTSTWWKALPAAPRTVEGGKGQSAFWAAGFGVLTRDPRSRHRGTPTLVCWAAGWHEPPRSPTRDRALSVLTLWASLSGAAPRPGRRGTAPGFHTRGEGGLPLWRGRFRVFPAKKEQCVPDACLVHQKTRLTSVPQILETKLNKKGSDPVSSLTYLTSTVDKILALDLSFVCLHTGDLTSFDHNMKNTCPVIDLNTCPKVNTELGFVTCCLRVRHLQQLLKKH